MGNVLWVRQLTVRLHRTWGHRGSFRSSPESLKESEFTLLLSQCLSHLDGPKQNQLKCNANEVCIDLSVPA